MTEKEAFELRTKLLTSFKPTNQEHETARKWAQGFNAALEMVLREISSMEMDGDSF